MPAVKAAATAVVPSTAADAIPVVSLVPWVAGVVLRLRLPFVPPAAERGRGEGVGVVMVEAVVVVVLAGMDDLGVRDGRAEHGSRSKPPASGQELWVLQNVARAEGFRPSAREMR